MTLEQIDADLSQWEQKLRSASNNMLELSSSMAYQRLLGEANWPKAQLSGATARRAEPVLQGLHDLWVYYSLLCDTIGQAQKLRGSLSSLLRGASVLTGRRAVLAEIEHLLKGPSIELAAVVTPLEQRDLSAAAEAVHRVEPEKLLTEMKRLFQQGRDVVLAIGGAWDSLPQQFAADEAEFAALEAADASFPAEVAALRGQLAALVRDYDADPLSALAGSQELAAEIKALHARIDQLAADRKQVAAELKASRRLLADVSLEHRQAAETVGQCRQKVQCEQAAASQPADDALVAALETWLAKLDAEFAAGRWQPVRVGIERWKAAAEKYRQADRLARSAAESLLNRRRDLRGLLGALKAKAADNGRREDAALAEIEQKANDLLAARPTPLDRLERAVADYQQRLL